MGYKIIVDEEKCIGCGACAAVCDNFEMDDEKGKAKVKQADIGDAGCNTEAADACPVDAIKVEEG